MDITVLLNASLRYINEMRQTKHSHDVIELQKHFPRGYFWRKCCQGVMFTTLIRPVLFLVLLIYYLVLFYEYLHEQAK